MKKPWTAPGSSHWGEPRGHAWAHSSIRRREGEMGARRLPQHPTGSCWSRWLRQQERICRVRTRERGGRGDPFVPHLLFNFSLLPAAPRVLQAVSANAAWEIIFFPLRVAERQRSRNPPARCRAAKNPALRSQLSAPLKTPETFSITTIQPQTRSYLKGNRQKPAKTTRKGERVIPQRKVND